MLFRLGLSVPTAAAGSYGGNIQVTPEDVERYGLVAPSGFEDAHEPVTGKMLLGIKELSADM